MNTNKIPFNVVQGGAFPTVTAHFKSGVKDYIPFEGMRCNYEACVLVIYEYEDDSELEQR